MSITRHPAGLAFRRIIAIGLICLSTTVLIPSRALAISVRQSRQTVSASPGHIWGWFTSVLATIGLVNRTSGRERKGVRPAPPASKAERESQVAALDLNVGNEIVLKSRQRISLAAIPVDWYSKPIHGLTPKWDSSNKQVVFIKKNGDAVAGKPGVATLTARAGNKYTTVSVTVLSELIPGKKRTDSTRRVEQAALDAITVDERSALSQKRRSKGKRAHAVGRLPKVTNMMPFIRDPNDDPLPDNETTSLYQTNNLIGTPPGKTKRGALTSASAVPVTENGVRNFNFALPVAALPGRGIDVSLALVYNSQLWHKSTNPSTSSTWMTYDVDSGYPAPGFRIGYGQIEDQGSSGYTLTVSNGTRRALTLTSGITYDTTDGSFIRFIEAAGGGTLIYPDGTRVLYGATGGGYRSYPTTIIDRNGNYIAINYVNGVGPRIYSIQDTVGRYVRFYYDSNDDLVTITIPGLTGQSDLQVMRFYYENLTLPSGLFASGINVSKPSTARVIRYIYLPSSADGSTSGSGDTGFRFDYSQYGMIYQIVRFRGMTASTTSTSSTGTVTEGTNTTAATTTHDYNTTASGLSDVPTFGHRADEWAGRTNGGSAPEYTFSLSEGSTETTYTVTGPAPNGPVSVTRSIKNSGSWNDGLIKEMRLENGSTSLFAKTEISWEQNSTNGTARIANLKFTNEASKTTGRVFTYDSSTPYNNVSAISERGFTSDGSLGSELRRIETTYVTSSNYLDRRLLHLPSMVKVFPGGSSTPASRIDYAYDNYDINHANLTSRDDIIMHDDASDPFQQLQEICDWECAQWGYTEGGLWGCINWQWVCHFYTPYDQTTDYRGNVTRVTTYPDATTTSGTITHDTTYDIAGNVTTAQVDCCQLQTYTYSTANDDYAYPLSVTKGNPSGLHLTTSTTYDINTGLVASLTDANNQVSNFAYNTESLRLDHMDFA